MINRKKLIGILASVVLAAVGTGLLVTYVRGAEDRAYAGDETVRVLVVTDSIAKGTKSEDLAAKVRAEQVPAKVAATGAVADIGLLAGRVTDVDLVAGEQVVQSRFVAASEAGEVVVPPGALKVTVSLEAAQAVGGQVRKGDSVGILISFDDPETTHLVLHKVPVTDVRNEDGVSVTAKPEEGSPMGTLFVTLALDGPSVEKVVFAAEHGRLWLSKQPLAASELGTQVQTRELVNQ